MKFDIYGISKIIRSGKAYELNLVENAISKLGGMLMPLSITENFVFVANRENGRLYRIKYSISEEMVNFSSPSSFEVESNSDRLEQENKKVIRNIVEAISENDEIAIDSFKAKWLAIQRQTKKLTEAFDLEVGFKTKEISKAKELVTESVNSTRGARSLFKKGVKTSLLHQLFETGSLTVDPQTPSQTIEPKSREILRQQKVVEARRQAKGLAESPVFPTWASLLVSGDKDSEEAVEFIAENYQEIFCLSLSEQAQLFQQSAENDPSKEQIIEGLLRIRDYALADPQIREGLEQLVTVVGATVGDFHTKVTQLESSINTRTFTPNDASTLQSVMAKVLESPSEFLAPEFLVELRRYYQRVTEMIDNGNYDDRLIAATIHMLSNFYPSTMPLGEAKKDDAEYKKYFDEKLKKWGVDSPKDIPADKKDDFFDEVDKGWKAANEAKKEEEEDKNATKNIYGDEDEVGETEKEEVEEGSCGNCGANSCICNGTPISEEDEEVPGEVDDEEVYDADGIMKTFTDVGDHMSDEDISTMESRIRQLKVGASEEDLFKLEELEDKLIMVKANRE